MNVSTRVLQALFLRRPNFDVEVTVACNSPLFLGQISWCVYIKTTRLNMGGLGEHVEGMHALQTVAVFAEIPQVAGEGAGVAGDIDDFLWGEVDESLAGFGVETSAWWIEHDQVDRFDLLHELGQDHLHRSFIQADILKLVQVAREIETGRGGALDGGQLAGEGGKKTGEKPNPAVELKDRQGFP